MYDAKRAAQSFDGCGGGENGPPFLRHEGEKEGATRGEGASVLHGGLEVGLAQRNPTFAFAPWPRLQGARSVGLRLRLSRPTKYMTNRALAPVIIA